MNFWPFNHKPSDRPLSRERAEALLPGSKSLTDAIKAAAGRPDAYVPTPPDPDWQPPPLPLADSTHDNKRIREEFVMRGAEWHAFRAQQLEAAGDEQEARLHLGDASEYLTQIGGPNRVQSAEEIYQYCAARRAGEK